MIVGDITAKVVADVSNWVNNLKLAGKTQEEFIKGVKEGAAQAIAEFQKTNDASKKLANDFSKSTQQMTSSLRGLASAFGVTLGAGAVVSYVKGVVQLASSLKDLEGQTGISAETLSRLKTTLEQNGATVDQFARSAFNMSRQIGEIKTTTDPALKAIKDLGLNFEDLRRLNTEEQMRAVAGALAHIDDAGKRAALGTALMGPAFRQVQSALMDVAKGLDELNAGLSDEQIDRLNEFSNAWATFANVLKYDVANALLTAGHNLDVYGAKFRQWLRDTFPSGSMKRELMDPLLEISKERDAALLAVPEGDPQSHIAAQAARSTSTLVNKEAENKIKSLTESLNKQIDALKVHALELRNDDEAAIR